MTLELNAPPDRVTIAKHNRALAYLRTQQYEAVLSDTGYPDFGPEPHEKSMFRAVEALYSLQRFDECSKAADKFRDTFPDSQTAREQAERISKRLLESLKGKYDFALLQEEVLKHPWLDHATYTIPVEVRDCPTRGRGLFVKQATWIKAGSHLLCEKAFVYDSLPKDALGDYRPETSRMKQTTAVLQKLTCNPSLIPDFAATYSGTDNAVRQMEVDFKIVLDRYVSRH